ncbi:hypothetical protein [Glycomyces paridis]|uniref:Uncharacterized protein n=1 Tax=Glycomyces paridis TaxID=2126555 RepID=A0A4S8P2G5_9ACTN|nr:hypothetical protein [Glycomyces paridis]THV23485.1 hypothetical protein E9998_23075 [Glycomyces paridis]
MPRFGETSAEQEILARTEYRRALLSLRLAFPFWAAGVAGLIAGAVWAGPCALVAVPCLIAAAMNGSALKEFVDGGDTALFASRPEPAADQLFARTMRHLLAEALLLARPRR